MTELERVERLKAELDAKLERFGDSDIMQLTDVRFDLLKARDAINIKLSQVENHIKEVLVKEGRFDLLSVNWTRLNRISHHMR